MHKELSYNEWENYYARERGQYIISFPILSSQCDVNEV